MPGVGVIYRDASVVTARPVVPPPIAEPQPPEALAGGSQLNKTAVGGPYAATELDSGSSINVAQKGSPWPPIINGAIKFFTAWKANRLRQISTHNINGNYGSQTGQVNFGWRSFEFAGEPNMAGLPVSNVRGNRPEWNNLIPIIFGLKVINPVAGGTSGYSTIPQSVASQFTRPTDFTPTGTASLSLKGEVLQ